MYSYTKILIKLLLLLALGEANAQYWVRSDITIADSDVLGGFNTELKIKINGNAIIDLSSTTDGNMNSGGRRQVVNNAFNGFFPSQVQFYDYISGASIAPPDGGGTNSCYPDGLGGSTTNNANTSNNLFLGPFGGNGGTYFGCDEIIASGPAQFFQVWRLNDLPQPDKPRCIDEAILLDPQNWGASIRRVLYSTNTMSTFESIEFIFLEPRSSYTVDLNSLPNLNTPGIVRFRLDYGNGVLSDIVTYTITSCSPEIVGQPETKQTTCNYSNDGEFTVTFDRPLDLDNGEQLTNIGVYSAGPDGVINTSDDVFTSASPPTASYTGSTYTYPNPLPAGEYILSYQATNASSDELSDPFVINNPPSLAYTITATDISCFEEDNGTITITIDPSYAGNTGSNPTYYYTINGGTPVTFDTHSTTINSLGVGVREIKVFDYKNCTERL
ncbi:SprB repeat-containing protein [Dokdonia sp. Hel_I_53]|uniref:SprB repeat-containing protein n=1 Tax=Dokdonia sp. Hel_I_53 TaxID=1566287 RepID=UPI001199F246|nr:SprB repeat-containing protein [Dokdonia sp. Hel_I_53]TVZ53367.1 hypothetical protein OD90_2573 [Dokdonia sp. Hel_I_53]